MRDALPQDLVSVIIPAFNGAGHLLTALQSVAAQSYRPLELIVVDDGSTDPTASLVHRFADQAREPGFQVRYLFQENGGPSKARNTGIRNACGRYLSFLDADDVWLPEKIGRQMALFAAAPALDLVFCDALVTRARDGVAGGFRTLRDKGLDSSFFGHPYLVLEPLPKLLSTNYIPTSSVLAKRECFAAGCLFNEARRHVEDWELWLQLASRFSFGYLDEPLLRKVEDGSGLSSSTLKMATSAIEVLEQFIKARGGQPGQSVTPLMLRARLGSMCKWTGYRFLKQGDYPQACRYLRKSLGSRFELRSLLYYLNALSRRALSRSCAEGVPHG